MTKTTSMWEDGPQNYHTRISQRSQAYHLLTLTMYRPFSKSYMVFIWGFFHFSNDQMINTRTINMTNIERNEEEPSIKLFNTQAPWSSPL